jgi:hypothetical protein
MTRLRVLADSVRNAELPRLHRRADIMAMPDVRRRYTVREVQAFPEDGNKYELIGGELHVTPPPMPRHQLVLHRLDYRLRTYLTGLGRADTLISLPADISWDDETLVQPDMFVVVPEELTNSWTTYRTLLLVVEQVENYCVVDHDAGLVEIWQPGDERPRIEAERLTWRVAPDAPEVTIDLVELFRELPE